MIPGTRQRIAIAAILVSLLCFQIQNDPNVICLQEDGTSRIEPAWIDGSCLCIHRGDTPSPSATLKGSERIGCRDISLKSIFDLEHSRSTAVSPTCSPQSIPADTLHPGRPTVFPVIAVYQPPGTDRRSLPLRC